MTVAWDPRRVASTPTVQSVVTPRNKRRWGMFLLTGALMLTAVVFALVTTHLMDEVHVLRAQGNMRTTNLVRRLIVLEHACVPTDTGGGVTQCTNPPATLMTTTRASLIAGATHVVAACIAQGGSQDDVASCVNTMTRIAFPRYP